MPTNKINSIPVKESLLYWIVLAFASLLKALFMLIFLLAFPNLVVYFLITKNPWCLWHFLALFGNGSMVTWCCRSFSISNIQNFFHLFLVLLLVLSRLNQSMSPFQLSSVDWIVCAYLLPLGAFIQISMSPLIPIWCLFRCVILPLIVLPQKSQVTTFQLIFFELFCCHAISKLFLGLCLCTWSNWGRGKDEAIPVTEHGWSHCCFSHFVKVDDITEKLNRAEIVVGKPEQWWNHWKLAKKEIGLC